MKADVAGHDICFPFRARFRFVANVAELNSPSLDGSLRTDVCKYPCMVKHISCPATVYW